MDTLLQDSPVDKTDAYASTAEDLPAPIPSAQDQTAALASSSDDQVVPDVTDPQGITPKRNVELPVSTHRSSETPKSKTIRVKAQRSRSRLLTLIACISYLLFHLMGVNIGLRAIQGYTEPRLQHAKVHLENTHQALAVDYLLDIQLINLHDTILDRRYMETGYEECLVRGLNKANYVFRGLDFTSCPHVRNQTADWVTSNCRRLLYTPQVHSLRASKLRRQAEHIRQTIEKMLKLVRSRFALLQGKLQPNNSQLAAKPFLVDSANNKHKHLRVVPDMPYGFSLECQDQTRCRLFHSGPITPDKTSKTLKDAVTDARKEVEKWSWKLGTMSHRIDYLRTPLAILQPLLVLCYLFATMINLRRPQSPGPKPAIAEKNGCAWKRVCHAVAHFQHDERHAVGLIINTALYALLSFQLEYIVPEFDRLLLPFGLGFCVFHSIHFAAFIDPHPVGTADQSVHDVVVAVKELYLIAQGVDVPEPTPAKRPASKPKTRHAAKPASKIAARFISPLTPIAEDLQRERKTMRAEQVKAPRDYMEFQYGYATETDDGYDSDAECSSYVDLAGGVTPTDSEDDDMVVVAE
ncbi:uncharacterized protein M421DRAFT_9101 [Didymella exigua CBS 183.55]|uniref:Uncharacterized protein n=1 Tax=Didymella exigua CBS 183.55 TaxID=1150837 RepID=A0A6A5RA95_9PLEO|nr:uncharacterized protein M421DRAFT_9101 [Didymella exigua CBS 183.55]KAF1924108.1 hypothetical protein M421DRAFT_9101 [Didymella exigua CBS 183.55]